MWRKEDKEKIGSGDRVKIETEMSAPALANLLRNLRFLILEKLLVILYTPFLLVFQAPRLPVSPSPRLRLPSSLERLRKPEVHLRPIEAKDRRRAVKSSHRSSLRNQKLRRIQKEAIINRERTAHGRLNSEAKADSVAPASS